MLFKQLETSPIPLIYFVAVTSMFFLSACSDDDTLQTPNFIVEEHLEYSEMAVGYTYVGNIDEFFSCSVEKVRFQMRNSRDTYSTNHYESYKQLNWHAEEGEIKSSAFFWQSHPNKVDVRTFQTKTDGEAASIVMLTMIKACEKAS